MREGGGENGRRKLVRPDCKQLEWAKAMEAPRWRRALSLVAWLVIPGAILAGCLAVVLVFGISMLRAIAETALTDGARALLEDIKSQSAIEAYRSTSPVFQEHVSFYEYASLLETFPQLRFPFA